LAWHLPCSSVTHLKEGVPVRLISIRLMTALAVAAGLSTPAPHAQTPTTIPGPTPAAVPCASVTPGLSDAVVMLSHIEDVLNEALGKTPAAEAALKKDTRTLMLVPIERDKLDQIRAEIEQIKVTLKK
jgi:hypothetical protein